VTAPSLNAVPDAGIRLDSEKAYRQRLRQLQEQLLAIQQALFRSGQRALVVFEGADASGKGGTIRRITELMDPRGFRVHPIGQPNPEEQGRHYLWRFFRHLPPPGRVAIFDRSWYGRVLVERVEGFAGDDEWRRAFAEINDFEDQLIESDIVLLKFWLQISKDEQLGRFKAREVTPHKRWKLQDEDWRNRERWDAYNVAAHEMIQQTSVSNSPWILVENESKHYGRIKVLNAVCDALEAALRS